MVCSYCGAENEQSATFCRTCGTRLDDSKNCSSCGAWNKAEAIYCQKCGVRLDGKKQCLACGELLDGDAAFCIRCGKAVGGTTRSRMVGVVPIVAACASIALAVVSILFVCLIRFNDTFFYTYFGSAYQELRDMFSVSNKPGLMYSDTYKAAMYAPVIFGTLISAGTLISVVVLALSSVIQSIRYLLGNVERDGGTLSFAAFAAYVAGFILLYALYAMRLPKSLASIAHDMLYAIDGVTVAGLVVTGIIALLQFVVMLVADGKRMFNRQTVMSTVLTLVGIAVSSVVLICSAIPLISVRSAGVTIRFGFLPLALGVSTAVPVSAADATASEIIRDAEAFSAVATLSFVVQIALVVCVAGLLCVLFKSLTDGTARGAGLAGLLCTIGAVFLILSIVTGSKFIDFMIGQNEMNKADAVAGYAVPIVLLVFSTLSVVVTVLQNRLCASAQAEVQ